MPAWARPPSSRGWLRFVELPLGTLVAGTKYRGEFEERVQKIVDQATADPTIVLFLDEIHMLVGAGDRSGGMDAANLFKPALARGSIRVIGATTIDEFRTSIEKDPALERRFSPVRIDEPTPEEARVILDAIARGLSRHHGVTIEEDAVAAAIELSVRYLPERRLPDKARDVLDQAASAARFATFSPTSARGALTVGRDDVAAILAEWTGVPVDRMTSAIRERLVNLEATLGARVLGQEAAVRSVAEVVRTGMAGLGKSGRPRGSMLFVGPTGVGKTELAKTLAEALFGDERSLLRFDMSEYQERFTAQKLIGSPPGYVGHDEGGQLVNAIRRTPYSVVLFDEIEKADPQVLDLLLQVLDDGRLTDSQGKVGDFSNAFVLLTSNLLQRAGGAGRAKRVGFAVGSGGAAGAPASPEPRSDDDLRSQLATRLRPELVGRIQRVVDFLPLGAAHLGGIADKALRQIARQAAGDARVRLTWSAEALDGIVDGSPSLELGARAIERLVEQAVARPLADAIVAGRAAPGSEVRVVARPAAAHGETTITLAFEGSSA
jgi:ATP-dependent Clp protease ATP-binding subunit ClpC